MQICTCTYEYADNPSFPLPIMVYMCMYCDMCFFIYAHIAYAYISICIYMYYM